MWQMIPSDFDVSLVSEDRERRLFAARRESVWHFVKAIPGDGAEPKEGFFHWDIGQAHLPRYSVAVAVSTLKHFNDLHPERHLSDQAVMTYESDWAGIYSRGPGIYDITLLQTARGLPPEVLALIQEDIDKLAECSAPIKMQDGYYFLLDEHTPEGHPIISKSRRLVEAIAFEKVIFGELNAERLGIYAAFSLCADLKNSGGLARDYFAELVKNQLIYNAVEFRGSPFLDLVMSVQSKLFPKPIWGLIDDTPIAMPETEAIDIVVDAARNLSDVQQAQIWMMVHLHSAGLFLPLAQVVGANSWNRYTEWKTQGLQPDSEEEQTLRLETAFIKLLGDLDA
jgi:hypothetical protein